MVNRSTANLPPLARALKAWRAREGLSQREAAETVGVPFGHWANWEQRGRSPNTNLAEATGAIILSLLGEQ